MPYARDRYCRDVWSRERTERLAALWAEGKTTGQIARELGVSRNAVIGKAHRLGLQRRPSPIKRTAPTVAPLPALPSLPKIPRGARITLPPLPSLMEPFP
jgi:hypothetical protein